MAVSDEAVEAVARRRHPLLSRYNEHALAHAIIDAREDLEAALPHLEGEGALRELTEAVEYAEGQLRPGSGVGAIPQENAARAYRRLESALDKLTKDTGERHGGDE